MSWSDGSSLMDEVISILSEHISDDTLRTELYAYLINAFEDHDCDTLDECVGQDAAFDRAFKEMHDDDDDDDEEEDDED